MDELFYKDGLLKMKNDFIKQKNNVVKNRVNGSKMLAFIIIIIVSLSAVLSAVFSGLFLFKDNRKTAYADTTFNAFISPNYFMHGFNLSQDYFFEPKLAILNLDAGVFYPLNNSNFNSIGYSSNSLLFDYSISFSFNINNSGNITFNMTGINRGGDYYFIEDRFGNTPLIYEYTGEVYQKQVVDTLGNIVYSANYSTNFFVFRGGSGFFYGNVYIAPNWDGNVSRIESLFLNGSTTSYSCPTFKLYDTNGFNCATIIFYTGVVSPDSYFLQSFYNSTYYTSGALDLSYTSGYNAGVAYGNENGFNKGFNDGRAVGYESGYNEGVQSSYQVGFNAGVLSANNYSFLGLMSAVVDAPVQALTGLLNFNILGFNMLSFFTGLLTLSLILWIVSKVLGNK